MKLRKVGTCKDCKKPLYGDEYGASGHRCINPQDKMSRLKRLTAAQAEDPGLWCHAYGATEAYLQQELRKLHALIEEEE